MTWPAGSFLIALSSGPELVKGYTYRGLGLHVVSRGSPKGRRPPTWALTHLGSGHSVMQIKGRANVAFLVATEVAESGDWDFDGLDGWKNRDPELPAKLKEIMSRHANTSRSRLGSLDDVSRKIAAQIAMARAS